MNFANTEDPVLRIIRQYKNHLSILALNAKFKGKQYSFQPFSKSEIKKEALNLDYTKAC